MAQGGEISWSDGLAISDLRDRYLRRPIRLRSDLTNASLMPGTPNFLPSTSDNAVRLAKIRLQEPGKSALAIGVPAG